jgi:hypothetical protein
LIEAEACNLYVLEIYAAKPDKVDDIPKLMKKMLAIIKKNPEKFKQLKSYSGLQHVIGTWGGFYEAWEVDKYSDFEKIMEVFMTDPEFKAIPDEFFKLVVPGTHHFEIVNEVAYYKP